MAVMKLPASDVTVAICKAVGIDHELMTDFTYTHSVGDIPRVTATFIVIDGHDIQHIERSFELVETTTNEEGGR